MNMLRNFFRENKFPIEIFFISKALLIAISIIAAFSLPVGAGFKANTDNQFLNLWSQWDGKAYLTIAEHGYVELEDGRSLLNFLPFYPFLIYIFSFIGYGFAGFLISNIATVIGVIFLYKLVSMEYGEKISKRATFFLLFFPTAFFLTAIYTEALFFALVLASFYYARTQKWIFAGIIAIPLPLTRIIGLAFFIPLLIEYYHQRDFKIKNTDKKIVFPLLSIIGVVLFLLTYYAVTGNPFSYFEQQNLWNRSFQLPYEAFLKTINDFNAYTSITLKAYFAFGFILAIAAIVLVLLSIKRLRWSYTAYAILALVPPFFSGTFEAFSRFLLVIFPLFITLSLLCEDKNAKKIIYAIYVLFIPLLLFLTGRFVLGIIG